MKINFYEHADDPLLKFAVIVSRYHNEWVFCKHKQRNTYEVPGGHREAGEDILAAAKRELFEETGAAEFEIRPVCVYSVQGKNAVIDHDDETFGMLYFAEITAFQELPDFEIEKIAFFQEIPAALTYPLIQPQLIQKVKSVVFPQTRPFQEKRDEI